MHHNQHIFWRSDKNFRPSQKQAGYSIFDLLVTTMIIGTLAVGTASMAGLVQQTRITAEVNGLLAQLNLMRSESIKRGYSVTLCKSENGTTCSESSRWQNGWIIFVDKDRDWTVDADEEIIRVQQALAQSVTLRYGETGSYYHLTYAPTGYASPNATFSFCDGRGSAGAKAIIVHWTGRPRSSSKDSDNHPIDCTKNS